MALKGGAAACRIRRHSRGMFGGIKRIIEQLFEDHGAKLRRGLPCHHLELLPREALRSTGHRVGDALKWCGHKAFCS